MLTNPNQYSRWFYTSSIQLYSCNNLWLGCNWKLKSAHGSTGLKQLLLTHHSGRTEIWPLMFTHPSHSRTALPSVFPRGMAYIQSKLQVPMVTPSLKKYRTNTSCGFSGDEPDPKWWIRFIKDILNEGFLKYQSIHEDLGSWKSRDSLQGGGSVKPSHSRLSQNRENGWFFFTMNLTWNHVRIPNGLQEIPTPKHSASKTNL